MVLGLRIVALVGAAAPRSVSSSDGGHALGVLPGAVRGGAADFLERFLFAVYRACRMAADAVAGQIMP